MLQVTFVSACEKRALKRTRAVLDGYASRMGESTWMTPITTEGLGEVRALLRKSATRQTSVACYRSKGRGRVELLWTVGSRAHFGEDGRFAVNSTHTHSLRAASLPEWVAHAHLLATLAGLAHDLGKFVGYFQAKLSSKEPVADPIRHEWLSMLLIQELASGKSWHEAWVALERSRKGRPLAGDPALDEAGALAAPLTDGWGVLLYLITTHHKLLAEAGKGTLSSKNHVRDRPGNSYHAAPIHSVMPELPEALTARLHRLVTKVKALPEKSPEYWRAVAAVARMALILADHSVSAEDHADEALHKNAVAYANTSRATKGLNQALVWHLPAVSDAAGRMVLNIVRLRLSGLSEQSRSAIGTPATGAYAWQERAALAIRDARADAGPAAPVLVFNLAGTGAGKTRMNLRAAIEASAELAPRVATAQNLRTLTLQTHDAYREQVGVLDEELACVIGDRTAQQFHQHAKGSPVATAEADTDGNDAEPEFDVVGSGPDPVPKWLEHFLQDSPHLSAVISAPCLVSTVDFLAAAGDPSRQGHHALAMLRLITSDLILDEIDSYDPQGLVAVLRVVQAVAFWGRNLVVSSATLSYPVAKAVWRAYHSGLRLREELTGASPSGARAVLIDDLVIPKVLPFKQLADFYSGYRAHVHKMLKKLAKSPRRRPVLVPVDPSEGISGWHRAILTSVEHLHSLNAIRDPLTGKHVSVGLVRIANIAGAIPVANHLAKVLPAAKVACYHSRHFAVQRQHIEQRLDYLLNRKGNDPDGRILRDPEIRAMLDNTDAETVMLIVVATPVEEIGRDHDFDYAVIEPSSSQSIVQVCGRVLRHRLKTVTNPNVGILQYNRRAVLQASGPGPQARGGGPAPVFNMPGLESPHVPYGTADLAKLLAWDGLDRIDASLRFGEDHLLARLDDQSLEDSLERALPRVLGGEARVAHLWMSENTYRDWPLREQTTPSEDWALDPESVEYHRYEPVGKWKKPKWVLRDPGAAARQRRCNDWLALSLDDMQALAAEVGLPWQKAFAFKVTGVDRDFRVDESFGIEPVKAGR